MWVQDGGHELMGVVKQIRKVGRAWRWPTSICEGMHVNPTTWTLSCIIMSFTADILKSRVHAAPLVLEVSCTPAIQSRGTGSVMMHEYAAYLSSAAAALAGF
jgi:hypothetical protein